MAKIYVSSTYSDLKDYREAIYRTLRQMRHDVIAMEDYVATDQRPMDKCLNDITGCNLYVGIFAWRYGYIPDKDNPKQRSITELEYRKAGEVDTPRLIFLLDDKAPWSPDLMDAQIGEGNQGQHIKMLRNELKKEKIVSFFKNPDHLASLVGAAVQQQVGSVARAREPMDRLRVREEVAENLMEGMMESLKEEIRATIRQELNQAVQASEHGVLSKVEHQRSEYMEQLERAEKLFSQGADLYEQKRFIEAIEKWKAAKPLYERVGMPLKIADMELSISIALAALGMIDEAIEHYETAKPIHEKLAEKIAMVEMNIGYGLREKGRIDEALGHFEPAKTIFERLEMPHRVADAETNLGVASARRDRRGMQDMRGRDLCLPCPGRAYG